MTVTACLLYTSDAADGGEDQVAVHADHATGRVVWMVFGLVRVEVFGDGRGVTVIFGSVVAGNGYGKAVQAGA